MGEIVFVAALLAIAIALRERSPWLAAARIPASLVAGAVGWFVLHPDVWLGWNEQLVPAVSVWTESLSGISVELRTWPGILIAVVFAGMLLAKTSPGRALTTASLGRVGRQGLMVWIIVVGQTTVGLWVTWLLIQPTYPLPNSTGVLIETGFAGGHGTAAAMGTVFAHPTIGLEEGLDLGLLMATAGLAYGLISGVVWINVAIWRGWVEVPARSLIASRSTHVEPTTAESSDSSPAPVADERHRAVRSGLGSPRIDAETIDPLLLQVIWIVLAFAIGWWIQESVQWVAVALDGWSTAGGPSHAAGLSDAAEAVDPTGQALRERLSIGGVTGSFPLFIYTLFGGAILRALLGLVGQKHRIDSDTVHRLVATAMDVLVVSAVATLDVSSVTEWWVPFLLLFAAGAIWCTICLLVLSRWILPRPIWFHLGLINYGMSTGTTATGFVLLRTIDPELTSGAAEDYALAAPLSAPFVGGGMLTVALPLLVLERVPIWASATLGTLFVAVLIAIGVHWQSRQS